MVVITAGTLAWDGRQEATVHYSIQKQVINSAISLSYSSGHNGT